MQRLRVLSHLDPARYQRHELHSEASAWMEKNCYVDLIIEVLHAQGLNPLAMLPFTLSVDFVGDQWTFFKPQHSELRALYGVNIQELSIWRPLLEHAAEHLSGGSMIAVESDAFWLPDTSGTDYRQQHVKTTIALTDLDIPNQRLGYFHNAGYFELSGEDFQQIFRLNHTEDSTYLPLFAELIHVQHAIQRDPQELLELSLALLHTYLNYRPTDNPILRYAERFSLELPVMQAKGLAYYHAWAFNNTRQLGAAFELASCYLAWLSQSGIKGLAPAIDSFAEISSSNKSLILKVARAVNSKRALDLTDVYDSMANAWQKGMDCLDTL